MAIQVRDVCKALHGLPGKVPVRHRVTHHDRLLAKLPEYVRDAPRGLALAAARPDRGHGDHGLR